MYSFSRGISLVCAFLLALAPPLSPRKAMAQSSGIPILVYHRFDRSEAGPTTVRAATFDQQLVWLAEHHYHVLPLREVVQSLSKGVVSGDARMVAITADDGHRSVYTEMFPLIQRYRIPVTLFIYPSAISKASYALTWEQLRTMRKSDLVDVESHTYWHPDFRKERARLGPGLYRAFVSFQLVESKSVLGKKLGARIEMLAWHYGIHNKELEEAASQAGYTAAFAYQGGPARKGCDLFAIPRIPISDDDQGVRFEALLRDAPSKNLVER